MWGSIVICFVAGVVAFDELAVSYSEASGNHDADDTEQYELLETCFMRFTYYFIISNFIVMNNLVVGFCGSAFTPYFIVTKPYIINQVNQF